MPGPPPEVTTKRWFSDCSVSAPRGQQPRQLARVLVVARPLDRLAALASARPRTARRRRCSPRARSVCSARSARSRLSTRADPKNTTVSWIFCSLKRRSGSRYSARMRIGRASSLSRNSGSRYASGCCDIQANLPSDAMIPPLLPGAAAACIVTIGISGAVALAALLDLRRSPRSSRRRRRRFTRRPSKRLVIQNAMVIYGNAKPPYGPVDIVVQDGLISYIGARRRARRDRSAIVGRGDRRHRQVRDAGHRQRAHALARGAAARHARSRSSTSAISTSPPA